MDTTPNRKYPYPTGTDLVTAGPAAVQQLAAKVDADHVLTATQVIGDVLTAAAGWQLIDGELVTYAGITHLRVTIRRTGSALWLSGTATPEATGHLVATFKPAYAGDRPVPFLSAAGGPGPRRHGADYPARGALVWLASTGEVYLHGADSAGSGAGSIAQNEYLAFLATYPSAGAYRP
ncbi:hypothetical protein [Nocardioides pantholopis]|uniref:hypothetical protein n=1 Tax=Nocardioides pantholopis TaxID=2483798 RepID=UPI000FD7E9CA|nr:hypothetical protein [Nocardioides pantholopis]